jgi:hypothetical protein
MASALGGTGGRSLARFHCVEMMFSLPFTTLGDCLGARRTRGPRFRDGDGADERSRMMDYEFQHSGKRCAATGREFAPGETYYSVLVAEGAELKRYDYAADAWHGPPETAIGCWQSQVPDSRRSRKRWAPNDIMLQFWDELAKEPDKSDMRYVLTLLLTRRRVFRFEEEKGESAHHDALKVYCPRRDTSYEVPAVAPAPERIEQIQEELTSLLQ